MTGVVERYLRAVATQDWDGLRATVADDVVREGPFGDTYVGCEAYVAFLAALMPTLRGYAMDVARVTYAEGGRLAFAELSESVTVQGTPTLTPEVLALVIDGDGRIARVTIYTRRFERT